MITLAFDIAIAVFGFVVPIIVLIGIFCI